MTVNTFKKMLALLIGLAWVGLAQAQESINTSGGDATGSGGTVAYSVGQANYQTNSSPSFTVSAGVQQTYHIFPVGQNEEINANISLSVFPNPTVNHLTLQVSEGSHTKMTYQLHDLQGQLLQHKEVTTQQTQIFTGDLPSAVYFVKVLNHEKQPIKTFKIVKN